MALMTALPVTEDDYERAAREYEASLGIEDIMESTRHATQRGITCESFGALHEINPQIEPFNELLVQFECEGNWYQVVPDNMFLVTPHPPRDRKSFNAKFEPVGPFMTLEYVSEDSSRKDYELNLQKYRDLKVPYYLIFDPQSQDLEIYRLEAGEYVRLEPDTNGRVSVPELDLQIGLLNGWVRFWHAGKLLLLRSDLSRVVEKKNHELADRDAKLADQNAKLADQNAKLADRDAQIARQQTLNRQMIDLLRKTVERRAKQLGRNDVLERLAETTDLAQLQQWIDEL